MPARRNRKKDELLRELETARRNLSADFADVGDTLNVPRRFQESFRDHSLKWIGGGALAGVLLAFFSPRRRKSVADKAKRGFAGTAFFGLLGLLSKQILRSALPSFQVMAQQHLQQWLGARQEAGAAVQPEMEEDFQSH